MRMIRIPAPSGELMLTLEEASELAKQLTDTVREQTTPPEGLYISRFDIKLLLAGLYGNSENVLGGHVTRLHSAIIQAAIDGRISYDLACTRCNRWIVSQKIGLRCTHFRGSATVFGNTVEVSAASLVMHVETFCEPAIKLHGVGPAVREDMRYLVSKLTS